jgi:hypothetical protein
MASTPRAGLLYAGAGLGLIGLAWRGGLLDGALQTAATENATEADWLARLILTEGGGGVIGKPEGVGIAQTALNRVRLKGFPTIQEAVTVKAGKAWFGGRRTKGYCYLTETKACPGRTRGGKTVSEAKSFPRAVAFAQEMLAGTQGNPIGNRTHFVHPKAFKRKWGPCAPGDPMSKRWMCADPGKGLGPVRMPLWAVARSAGGKATHEPKWVGRALFSGLGADPIPVPIPPPARPLVVEKLEVDIEPSWNKVVARATIEGVGMAIGLAIGGYFVATMGFKPAK